jgi:hypothetical protein
MNCKLIFKLDDGREFEGKDNINEVLNFFPIGILDTIKSVFFETSSKTINWNISIITVFQNGTYNIDLNRPNDLPFSLEN